MVVVSGNSSETLEYANVYLCLSFVSTFKSTRRIPNPAFGLTSLGITAERSISGMCLRLRHLIMVAW